MRNLIYIFITVSLLLYFLFYKNNVYEYMSPDDNKFDVYVITMRNKERMENIEKQQEKIEQKIEIFDAVKGANLDINELIDKGEIPKQNSFDSNDNNKSKMKGQVGCYLSHYNIYKKIRQDNRLGYTIVFEDDFVIKDENLLNKIKKIIENTNKKEIDFDLLFLGNLKDNHGTQIVDNLYYVDKSNNLYGTHAYVVNNKNINKIIRKTENIDRPIDNKLEDCAKNETLNIIVVYPNFVEQGGSTGSTINDFVIEEFSSKYSVF